MNAATTPRLGPGRARLAVVDACGRVSHHAAADLPRFVEKHDVVVANDAATLPASLHGTHERTGRAIEVRLAGRLSLAPSRVRRFRAVVFGGGDYRTETERRAPPPVLRSGDRLTLGPLHGRVLHVRSHPRLIDLAFDDEPAAIWEGLSRHGAPIQYAYVPAPLAIWDTWTAIASRPVAFEAPSAGFVLDWAMVSAFERRGAAFVTITHAAGVSSTGDPVLDRALPFDEPYSIPASAAHAVNKAKRIGGRVLAVGTTVVRPLEHSAVRHGRVAAGHGIATNRVGPTTTLRVVDAIVSGMHERGSSHYELLRAFQGDEGLDELSAETERRAYRSHEFGDVMLVERNPSRPCVAGEFTQALSQSC